MNVVIACGGTGGHLFPGLAIAEVLRQRGHHVLLFLSGKEIDRIAMRDHAGLFRFEQLPSIGLPRLFSPAMIRFVRGLWLSVSRCRAIYREFKPDAVLGMGGFTSTAPMLAGRMMKLPTFIHESNAIPGKANRLNARLARVVLLGFAGCAKYFPASKVEIVGTPIRAGLRERLDQTAAQSLFGLSEGHEKMTLLVMGGSQGAHGLNEAVIKAAPEWKSTLQIIHFTGRDDEASVRAAYEAAGVSAFVAAFHHRMQEAYSAADFAIARSGASSLSELAFFGLPSLLIPYPFAAEDHQTLNARIFTAAKAAVMLRERETTSDYLAKIVLEILRDPSKLSSMAAEARRLAPPDAAALLVDTLEKQCRPTPPPHSP